MSVSALTASVLKQPGDPGARRFYASPKRLRSKQSPQSPPASLARISSPTPSAAFAQVSRPAAPSRPRIERTPRFQERQSPCACGVSHRGFRPTPDPSSSAVPFRTCHLHAHQIGEPRFRPMQSRTHSPDGHAQYQRCILVAHLFEGAQYSPLHEAPPVTHRALLAPQPQPRHAIATPRAHLLSIPTRWRGLHREDPSVRRAPDVSKAAAGQFRTAMSKARRARHRIDPSG